jgi:hypothetical protein
MDNASSTHAGLAETPWHEQNPQKCLRSSNRICRLRASLFGTRKKRAEIELDFEAQANGAVSEKAVRESCKVQQKNAVRGLACFKQYL